MKPGIAHRTTETILNIILISALILFVLAITLKSVLACDSYEDCMKGEEHGWIQNGEGKKYPMYVPNEKYFLKAIAYKLDEISKKLDK